MLRTIVFFAFFWLALLATTPVCVFFLLLRIVGLGPATREATGAVIRAFARLVMRAAGTRVTCAGLEKAPRGGKLVVVANHQGLMDIFAVVACLPRAVGFVAKLQAIWIPFINFWILATGSVFIDRGSVARGKESLERGMANIARGGAITVFPEGTRSRGPGMGQFRNGSFKLATRSGAVILPVTIDGTWKVWEERHRIRPARISFTVHDPIPTEGMDAQARKDLPGRVLAAIASGLSPGSR